MFDLFHSTYNPPLTQRQTYTNTLLVPDSENDDKDVFRFPDNDQEVFAFQYRKYGTAEERKMLNEKFKDVVCNVFFVSRFTHHKQIISAVIAARQKIKCVSFARVASDATGVCIIANAVA